MTVAPLDLVNLAAQHAYNLRSTIGGADTPSASVTASKTVLLSALHAAELDMLQTMALTCQTVGIHHPVCGVWTLQDLAGHLADWDTYFIYWLGALLHTPQADLYWDDDGARFNAWLWQRRKNEPWAQTWNDFRTHRRVLHQQLATVSEPLFLSEPGDPKNAPFPSVYHCGWSALEHYLEHAAGIRRQLQWPLPDELLHFHGPYTE